MSIKSDKWIRRMAAQGLIDPFEPGQVRTGENGRLISYGTSSYGYDVRCAREFKIFTNINSTIVDPKNFDEKSFVDVSADVCIIPPNSFALARTVEYFRIPRNVLTVCLGKSTYARCFSADTRVALVDGTSATLEEMSRGIESGQHYWGYSISEGGRLIVTMLDQPRHIGRDSLLEVTLDNGEIIRVTADHMFWRRDGRKASADQLRAGDSLMPLYRSLVRGYEHIYQPLNGHLWPTHRLADEWNVRHGIYADQPGTHRHHMDFDRRNPTDATREAFRAATLRRYQNPAARAAHSMLMRRAWAGDDAGRLSQAEVARNINLRSEITPETVLKALHETGSIRGAARYLSCDRSVFRRFPQVLAQFHGRPLRNHKVVSVRDLPGVHDVYCLTVPEAGNFALEAGVFVDNCGIIVNVTPLEPEWEGHVTLEFSNTTTLPAKIYANEGVAQMLFFESDEVCETSYADRGGKYQKQRGVTLPKA
jgi:dCTP deaminase